MLLAFISCSSEYVDQVYAPLGPPTQQTTTTPVVPANTWTVRDSQVTSNLFGAAVSGSTVVAVGGNSMIRSADSGATWTDVTPTALFAPAQPQLYDVIWNGAEFIAVAGPLSGGTAAYVISSADGATWAINNAAGGVNPYRALAYSSTLPLYVAVGSAGKYATSPDGIAWTHTTFSGTVADMRDVIWANNQFVATGGLSLILTSPDGTTWTQRNVDTAGGITGVAWSGTMFVAVGTSNTILRDAWTSADGSTWTRTIGEFDCDIYDVTWSGTHFVAAGINPTAGVASIRTSTDGTTWSADTVPGTPTTSSIMRIVGSDTLLVGVGISGTVITSP